MSYQQSKRLYAISSRECTEMRGTHHYSSTPSFIIMHPTVLEIKVIRLSVGITSFGQHSQKYLLDFIP